MSLLVLCCVGCTGLQFPLPRTMQTIGSSGEQTNPEQQRAFKSLEHPTRLPLAYAKMQEQLGNLIEAQTHYEHVVLENPKSTAAILGLARIDQVSGRTEEADRGFQRALELAPSDPHVLDTVGQFYASEKRWSEAIQMLNTAMVRNQSEPLYQYHLAVALAKSGDIKGCMPHFQSSVGDAEAHYNVGYILMDQGRHQEALQEFRIALSKKPSLEQAQVLMNEVLAEMRGSTAPTAVAAADLQQHPSQIRTVAAQQPRSAVEPSNTGRMQAGHSLPQMSSVVSNTALGAPLTANPQAATAVNQRMSTAGVHDFRAAQPSAVPRYQQ